MADNQGSSGEWPAYARRLDDKLDRLLTTVTSHMVDMASKSATCDSEREHLATRVDKVEAQQKKTLWFALTSAIAALGFVIKQAWVHIFP